MTKEGARLVVLACKLARVTDSPAEVFESRCSRYAPVRRAIYMAAHLRGGSYLEAGRMLGRNHASVIYAAKRRNPDVERLAKAILAKMQGDSHEGLVPAVVPSCRKHWLMMATDALNIAWRDQYLAPRQTKRGNAVCRVACRAIVGAGYSINATAELLGYSHNKVAGYLQRESRWMTERQQQKMAAAVDRMIQWILDEHGEGPQGVKLPCESQ